MAKIKICLDAGHYGKANRSPAVKTYYESDMNWKLHLLLKSELESRGFEVITTRPTQDKDLGLSARGKKSKGCALFLSLHSNAPGNAVREDLDYPLVIVMLDGKGHALGRKFADCIAKTMGTKQGGRLTTKKGKSGEYYGVLRGAASVGTMGMILEHSFHTNTRSTKWLLDENNLAKMAKAEADIIAEYFGVGESKTPTSGKEEQKPVEEKEEVCSVNIKVLKNGAKGAEVKSLQILLIGYGYSCGSYGADGSFGTATDKAVREFQKAKGLTVDGACGPKTWAKLLGVS